MNIAVNVLMFQLGWFACVLGAAFGYPLGGTLVALALVAVHLWRAQRWRPELVLVLLAALIGGSWDSLLVAQGWFRYAAGQAHPGLAPYWIVALWMVFATTLNVSLRWLKPRLLLAAVLGAIAGPLAYYAGHGLGALAIPDPALALGAQALGWGLLLPALVWLSGLLDGMGQDKEETRLCLNSTHG